MQISNFFTFGPCYFILIIVKLIYIGFLSL